jgi:hypothetical protein
MLSKSYPKCIHSLNKWLQECQKRQSVYNRITPQLFDVTLTDELRNVSKEMLHIWTTPEKKNTYYRIKFNHNPKRIEVGSLVSPKVLPIFSDSLDLHKSIEDDFRCIPKYESRKASNLYLFTPNQKMLEKAIENCVTNFSFITSVSNAFQKNTINKTIAETKKELELMSNEANNKGNIKLYISCINECPFNGLIDNDYIVNELLLYEKNEKIGEMCLSDTCGTLKFEDFEYIIDNCLYFGLPASKLSLHLHYSEKNLENTKQIVNYAFDKNINKFDVSMIESGGCSTTIKKENCVNNLSYELFYRFLVDYIEKRANHSI